VGGEHIKTLSLSKMGGPGYGNVKVGGSYTMGVGLCKRAPWVVPGYCHPDVSKDQALEKDGIQKGGVTAGEQEHVLGVGRKRVPLLGY